MFDEIEFITQGISGTLGQHWDSDYVPFWQTIRSIHQETQGKLIFIVAGVNPTCVEKSHFNEIQNPIFQLAVPFYLEPFGIPQVREMVRSIGKYTGVKFNEDVYAYLQATYGGHPFLTRIACSEVWRTKDKTNPEIVSNVSIIDFKAIYTDIKNRLSAPIKDILLSLVWWYPEEYDILRILAAGDKEFVQDYLKTGTSSVFQFAKYGLLKKDSLEEFAITDLRDFLIQNGENYKNEISPFLRGDIPPEILPEIPDLAAVGRLFEKRSDIELKLRKAIIMYLSIKHTFDAKKMSDSIIKGLSRRSDRSEPKDLFIGRTPQVVINQLYAPDLKGIISENWDVFNPLFENKKQRFEMNMDTLNIARRIEAHTKPVTKEELIDFENSYSWLLRKLSKITI